MPDRVSSLAGALSPRTITPEGVTPAIRLSERQIHGLWQMSAWPDRLAETAAAVARAAGIEAAPGPGQSATGSATAMRTEPLKWLVASEGELAPPALDPADGTVLDLSHARSLIRVEGDRAPQLMARLFALDCRPGAFPEGSVATAPVHHVGVTLLGRGGGFDLFVPQSFALSLWEHIVETAAQFGVEIG